MSAPVRGGEPSPQSIPKRRPHDLRLVGPALAVWATAGVLVGTTPLVAYTVAGAAALGAVLLLLRRRPPAQDRKSVV